MTEVDILIVGGRPAGLLTASQLAIYWHVALIERGELGNTTKYCVTSERRLRMLGLTENILFRSPVVLADSFLGGSVRTTGVFAVVNDESLLRELSARCRERKSRDRGALWPTELSPG